ncbi:MAG: glycosyltransferase [Bacteroidetes bacterium]|nr:glycosyltransferase [Bacteroidota bacterium]
MTPKILIISSRIPYPLLGGDRIRIYNICRNLTSAGYKCDFLFLNNQRTSKHELTEIKKVVDKVFYFDFPSIKFYFNSIKGLFSNEPIQSNYYYFNKVQNYLDGVYKHYDLIFCNHIRTSKYAAKYGIPKIVDLHDAISLNYSRAKQYTTGIWDWIYKIESKRVLRYELEIIKSFNKSLIVSQVDKDFLVQNGADSGNIEVLPVAVDESYLNYQPKLEKDWLIFVGKMNTVANSDAVVYFSYDIFPTIKQNISQSEFLIVGADPTKRVNKLSNINGVRVTGKVENHIDFLLQAKVVVAPMRFGAGMQNKILEAMALGKPVVTTTIGAEGINGENGIHFLIADAPSEFAAVCKELLNNQDLRTQIGSNARELIRQKYTWNTLSQKLYSIIDQVIAKHEVRQS